MRLSPALYVRQWLAKLHPPLPQTPRESQQLLRILEGSFRKHLDEVHPPPAQRSASHVIHSEIPLVSSESSSSATQHYFNTVLNHPLLAKAGEKSDSSVTLTTSAINLFAKASNDGNVTIPLLRRCAEDYLKGLKNGEMAMDRDGFAEKLASWVYTTSLPMKEAFFASKELLDLAVRVAGIDRKEAVVWDWLRMLYEREFISINPTGSAILSNSKWMSVEDRLVSSLMRMSINRGDLADAAQQFIEASQYRFASGRAATRLEDVSERLAYSPLEQSWKRLIASVVHYRQKHGISENLFQRLLYYGMSWTHVPHFSVPVMLVYHPKSPSASSLSQHLQDPNHAEQFLSGQVGVSRRFRRAMLMMILDGAQLSSEQGHRNQAQTLLDFAHTHYAEFLPAKSPKTALNLDDQIRNAQGELKAHSYNFVWT